MEPSHPQLLALANLRLQQGIGEEEEYASNETLQW
jgi:hypothetical protein